MSVRDLEKDTECTVFKSADGTKVGVQLICPRAELMYT